MCSLADLGCRYMTVLQHRTEKGHSGQRSAQAQQYSKIATQRVDQIVEEDHTHKIIMKNNIPLIDECCLCLESHNIKNCNILNNPHIVNDTSTPCKAYATLPSILSIEKTCDEKELIKTKSFLSKGTRFGPVDSQKTDVSIDTDFPLKVLLDLDKFTYLDTGNKITCNWMCLVQPASCFQECNLVAYQSKFCIYFSVIRNIDVNTELRVYYAPFYAEKIGVQFSRNSITSITDDVFDDLGDSPELGPDDMMMEGINHMPNPSLSPSLNIILSNSNNLKKSLQPVEDQSEWKCSMCDTMIISTSLFATHLRGHYNSKDVPQNQTRDKETSRPLVSNPNEILSTFKSSDLLLSEAGGRFIVNFDPTLELHSLTATAVPTTLNLGDELQVIPDLNLSYSNLLPSMNLDTNTTSSMTVPNDSTEATTKQVFTCDICGKGFAKVVYILRHLKQHEGKFHCDRCNKTFARNETLQLHDCVNLNYTCDQCAQTFTRMQDLKQHKISHHKQIAKFRLESLSCSQCSHLSDTMSNFIKHIRSHFDKTKSNVSMVQCPICKQSYTRPLVFYTKHLRNHEASEYCSMCKGVFHNRKTYEKHGCFNPVIRELPNQNPVKAKTNQRRRIKKPVNKIGSSTSDIDSSARFTCSVCFSNFNNETKFRLHKMEHEEAEVIQTTSVLCDYCGNSYDNASSLSKHIAKIHVHNKIQCPTSLCRKQFETSQQLMVHIQSHKDSNIRYNTPGSYPCTFCEKVFTLKKYRAKHIIIKHSTDYKHSCSICGKKFKIKTYLNSHIKHVHRNVPKVRVVTNRYGCHMCNRKFVRKSILRKHIESHSTIVSYACKLCPKTTIRRKFMINHLERVHQDRKTEWNREEYLKELMLVKDVSGYNVEDQGDMNGIIQDEDQNVNHEYNNRMTLDNQHTDTVNLNIHETNGQHLPENIGNPTGMSVLDHEDNLLNDDPMKLFDLNPESNSAATLLRQGRELQGDTITNFDLSVFCNEQSIDLPSSLYTHSLQFNTSPIVSSYTVNAQPPFSSNAQSVSSYTALNAETSYETISKESLLPETAATAGNVLPTSNMHSNLIPLASNQYCMTDNISLPLQTIQTADVRISAPMSMSDSGEQLMYEYAILDPASSSGTNVVTMDIDMTS